MVEYEFTVVDSVYYYYVFFFFVCVCVCVVLFCFFKQKTAYEI